MRYPAVTGKTVLGEDRADIVVLELAVAACADARKEEQGSQGGGESSSSPVSSNR